MIVDHAVLENIGSAKRGNRPLDQNIACANEGQWTRFDCTHWNVRNRDTSCPGTSSATNTIAGFVTPYLVIVHIIVKQQSSVDANPVVISKVLRKNL